MPQIDADGPEVHAQEHDGRGEYEELDSLGRNPVVEDLDPREDVVRYRRTLGPEDCLEPALHPLEVPSGQDRVVRVHVRGSIDPDLAVEGLPRRGRLVDLGQKPIGIPNVDDGDTAPVRVVWRR